MSICNKLFLLTSITDETCPCLAMIVHKLVTMMTLIANEIVPMFGIDSLQACVWLTMIAYEIVPIGLALIITSYCAEIDS